MSLLDIDETKKDPKKEEEYIDEELFDYDFNIIDPFMPNPILEQTLKMQDELKRIEEERKREEEERKKNNDKKPSSGPSLGALELLEEVREPTFEEFVRTEDKNSIPAKINNYANSFTGNTIEFEELLNNGITLLPSQIEIIDDYISFLEEGIFPEEIEMYSYDFLIRRENSTPIELTNNIIYCQNSLGLINDILRTTKTEEIIAERNNLTEYLLTCTAAKQIFDYNVNSYLKHTRRNYNE